MMWLVFLNQTKTDNWPFTMTSWAVKNTSVLGQLKMLHGIIVHVLPTTLFYSCRSRYCSGTQSKLKDMLPIHVYCQIA